jgi:DNA replication protein DnaC
MTKASNLLQDRTMHKAVGKKFNCPVHGEVPGVMCLLCFNEQASKEDEAEIMAHRSAVLKKKLINTLGHSGIPKRFMDRGFTNYEVKTDQQREVLETAKEYAVNFSIHRKAGSGFVFTGMTGTGKNHLAMAIAKQVIRDGYSAIYTTVLDATQHIREAYRTSSEDSDRQVIAIYASADLLVLDEVGVQMNNDSERVFITSIINKRYEQLKPTIVLSNLSPDNMQKYLGERVMSRLRETTRMLQFLWEDYRALS